MAHDPLAQVRSQIGTCIAEIRERSEQLSPLDLYARMEAIREIAAVNGLAGLDALARRSTQLALLPGHRVAVGRCLDHVDDAIGCRSPADCTAILAALAVRLH